MRPDERSTWPSHQTGNWSSRRLLLIIIIQHYTWGVRGHSPSRLTCTSAPTFYLEYCVFQWMLDCDSCQSAVCSSECWTVTAVRVLCDGVLFFPVNVGLWQLSECCVMECCVPVNVRLWQLSECCVMERCVFQWMLDCDSCHSAV